MQRGGNASDLEHGQMPHGAAPPAAERNGGVKMSSRCGARRLVSRQRSRASSPVSPSKPIASSPGIAWAILWSRAPSRPARTSFRPPRSGEPPRRGRFHASPELLREAGRRLTFWILKTREVAERGCAARRRLSSFGGRRPVRLPGAPSTSTTRRVSELLVSYIHATSWPSYTILYEPRQRRARAVFLAGGHHYPEAAVDLDGDGHPG
jgi:hypothetical protein